MIMLWWKAALGHLSRPKKQLAVVLHHCIKTNGCVFFSKHEMSEGSCTEVTGKNLLNPDVVDGV